MDNEQIDENLASLQKRREGLAAVSQKTEKTEGIKHDQEKPRMDLLPFDTLMAIATVLSYGAEKYDDRNWELGMDWGRIYAATQRHLTAFWSGENIDRESDLPHLWHALCSLMFLATYYNRGVGEDTRFLGNNGGFDYVSRVKYTKPEE